MRDSSYFIDKQRSFGYKDAINPDRQTIHESWFRKDTVDYWRHARMYSFIKPLANYFKDSSWLTIGDGRFGLDSIRLKDIFNINAFPTDISESLLKVSKQKGYIEDYGIENAEQLSFQNDSFDIVFCKESFHHFPRPIIAFYEMIRVARDVVVLIEPNDYIEHESVNLNAYLFSALKLLIGKILRRKSHPYLPKIYSRGIEFEDSGNFVYSVSNREMNKIVHGMDLGGLAVKTFNDAYIKGCENELAEKGNKVYEKIVKGIIQADANKRSDLAVTIIFKESIDPILKEQLESFGYTFSNKVKNPYID